MKLTPTDYIIMAYLQAAPMHVYGLADNLKNDKIDSWAQYSIPHLYYSLRRLKKEGLVSIEIKPSKGKPPQKIYSLTSEGLKHLNRLKNDSDLINSEEFFQFDLLPGFSERLGIDSKTLRDLIETRISRLQNLLSNTQENFRIRELQGDKVSEGERMVFRHRIRFLKSEIDFYKKSLKEFGGK